jgi:HTH-type transcriptional regulator/antitoxin HipB
LSPYNDPCTLSSNNDILGFSLHIRAPVDLGLIVRERRRKLGLSQSQLARTAGVGRQWLVALEQGKAGAELGMVLRTLSALGLALSAGDADMGSGPRLPIDIDVVVDAARKDKP